MSAIAPVAEMVWCSECTRVSDLDRGPGCVECSGTGLEPGVEVRCDRCDDTAWVHQSAVDDGYRCGVCVAFLEARRVEHENRECAEEDAWDARREERGA